MGVPGWQDQVVSIQIAVLDGVRQVTALQVEPLSGATPVPVTSRSLRHLPIASLADLVARWTGDAGAQDSGTGGERWREVFDQAKRIRRDPRAVTTPEAVAVVWMAAHRRGDRNKRAQVCQVLGIEARTADRYIRKARQAGLFDEGKDGE
jgi:hypothetical protein